MGFFDMNQGGWQGVNSGMDNIMRMYQWHQQRQLAREKMAQDKLLQDARIEEINAARRIREDALAKKQNYMGAIQGLMTPTMQPVRPDIADPTQGGEMRMSGTPQDLANVALQYGEPDDALKFVESMIKNQKRPDELTAKDLIPHIDKLDDASLEILGNKLGIPNLKAYRKPENEKKSLKILYKLDDPTKTKTVLAGEDYIPEEGWGFNKPDEKDKYRDIQARLELKEPVSAKEKAWAKAYEKQAQLGPTAYAEARKRVALEASIVPVWDTENQVSRNVTREEALRNAGRYLPMSDPSVQELRAGARQRMGAQAAIINSANDLYQENLPRLIELRRIVEEKGLLPSTRLRDINAINQWLSMKASDPDMAELQGKTKLMADNLQKTIGGAQGGEWAFKVADTLLDPALGPDAFERRMVSHGHDLSILAKSRREFGKNPVAEVKTNQIEAKKKLKVGDVVNGYKYKGGDTKNKSNWEKQ